MLQKKYQAIKQQRMEELETFMTEQQQRASPFTHSVSQARSLASAPSLDSLRAVHC